MQIFGCSTHLHWWLLNFWFAIYISGFTCRLYSLHSATALVNEMMLGQSSIRVSMQGQEWLCQLLGSWKVRYRERERERETAKTSFNFKSTYIPSWKLAYPITFGTFESMIFLFPRWDMLVPLEYAIFRHTHTDIYIYIFFLYTHIYIYDIHPTSVFPTGFNTS